MKKLLFISFLLFALPFLAQNETGMTPKIAIKIEQGKSINLHGLIVKFVEVTEDSRCPKYVNCIWAGRAIVQLEITDEIGSVQNKSIILGEIRGNESNDKTVYRKDGYFIEVISLNPYPEEGKESSKYSLLISEGK
jgi:hypothetical protein